MWTSNVLLTCPDCGANLNCEVDASRPHEGLSIRYCNVEGGCRTAFVVKIAVRIEVESQSYGIDGYTVGRPVISEVKAA